MSNLVEMLTYPRKASTQMEELFIHKYIDSIGGMKKDSFGNRIIRIGNDVDWCFTSHTDTVHHDCSKRQEVYTDAGYAYKLDGEPLGGDDTTGVWLMLNLIHDRFPGLYIFHREEEIGGRGSRYIASSTPELMDGIRKVISLDRKGYGDVLTHQSGIRCCSYEFAYEIARQLGGEYKPSQRGVFSDSANYDYFIPECTNLSIGYFNAHSSQEIQDLVFAEDLCRRMKRVNWERLPVFRDANEFDDWRSSTRGQKRTEKKKPRYTEQLGEVTWNYYPDRGWVSKEPKKKKKTKKKKKEKKTDFDMFYSFGGYNDDDDDNPYDNYWWW